MSEHATCRKCGQPITDEWAFGSNENGWEHLPECPPPESEPE